MATEKPTGSDEGTQKERPPDRAITNRPDAKMPDMPSGSRPERPSELHDQSFERSDTETGNPHWLPRWLGATIGTVAGAALGAGVVHQSTTARVPNGRLTSSPP